jgi:hypothetical protein
VHDISSITGGSAVSFPYLPLGQLKQSGAEITFEWNPRGHTLHLSSFCRFEKNPTGHFVHFTVVPLDDLNSPTEHWSPHLIAPSNVFTGQKKQSLPG